MTGLAPGPVRDAFFQPAAYHALVKSPAELEHHRKAGQVLDRACARAIELTEAGVEHETQVYSDAPHSFFDRTYKEWKEASDDAWRRILAFVKKHS